MSHGLSNVSETKQHSTSHSGSILLAQVELSVLSLKLGHIFRRLTENDLTFSEMTENVTLIVKEHHMFQLTGFLVTIP